MALKIKDTYTITGGQTYTSKTVKHLKNHVLAENWNELKSKLTNSETAKNIYGFTERNGILVFTDMKDKDKI